MMTDDDFDAALERAIRRRVRQQEQGAIDDSQLPCIREEIKNRIKKSAYGEQPRNCEPPKRQYFKKFFSLLTDLISFFQGKD